MTTAKPALDLDRLMVRVRRGDASVEERRAFEQALSASALLRVAHQLGRDFDEEARVQPGDDDVVARAASGALARRTRHVGKRRAILLGVAASLALATTAAATTSWLQSIGAHPPTPAPAPTGKSRAREPRPVPAAPHHAVETPSEPSKTAGEATPAAPTTAHRAAPRPSVEPTASSVAAPGESAASLFREANAARRAGNFELARARYADLQARYPETDEARVSRVSLGKLLLSTGRTREAEREFQSYLRVRGGSLDEEALVGRADALGRLGESGEERRVWELLLRDHPSTVYATRARQRLLELGRTTPSDSR